MPNNLKSGMLIACLMLTAAQITEAAETQANQTDAQIVPPSMTALNRIEPGDLAQAGLSREDRSYRGVIMLKLKVLADGTVGSATVSKSSGNEKVDTATVEIV